MKGGAYMLQAKLETLEGVDESLHSFYEEKDGSFVLQVDGLEDTGALKRAKEHEKEARKASDAKAAEYKNQIEELEAKLNDIQDDGARKNGDIEALEKSWSKKLSDRETELTGAIAILEGNLEELLVDNVAGRMAAELAIEGSAEALIPHIRARLGVDERDGKRVTIVKDGEGKPSATSIDELKAEFTDNPVFAPLIVGSRASGGGAGQSESGGGASHNSNLSKANPTDLVKHIKAKRGN